MKKSHPSGSSPPKLAKWLLKLFACCEDNTPLHGDFYEEYACRAAEKGSIRALLWFSGHLLKSIPFFIKDLFMWRFIMLSNYLSSAIRNIKKQRGYSVINILSLSVGIACCLMIVRFIVFETSYDNYHQDADRIYRINMEFWRVNPDTGKQIYFFHEPSINAPLISAIRKDIPQIESAVQMQHMDTLVSYEQKIIEIENAQFVDNEVFDIFNIHFIKGNLSAALERPFTVVISEDISEKLFEREEPLGKMLKIREDQFEVTGVVANPPVNTHWKYGLLGSFETVRINRDLSAWSSWGFQGYIKLVENIAAKDIEELLNRSYGNVSKENNVTTQYFLEPITKIHLNMGWTGEVDPKFLAIFGAIALIILLNACMNFVNLMTARSAHRAKEIGLRKVVGAFRIQIIRQFLCESILISLISTLGALVSVRISLPALNALTERHFIFGDFLSIGFIIPTLGLTFLVGITAGIYPAFFLSSFQPVNTLKGFSGSSQKGAFLRKILVVTQFTVSTALLISTLIIYRQTTFMKNKDLGFEKEQKLVIPFKRELDFSAVKSEFLRIPSVYAAAACSGIPGGNISWNGGQLSGTADNKEQILNHLYVDADYLAVLGMDMKAGRFFDKNMGQDQEGPFVINESAARSLGFTSPEEAVNKTLITYWGGPRDAEGHYIPQPILGVVRDFHYEGLHNQIKPLVFVFVPERFHNLALSIRTENLPQTLKAVETTWKKLITDNVYSYFFLDDNFNRFYKAEDRLMRIFTTFAGLAVFISCLGLFGLAAYSAERRTKEVGIRKVLGASSVGLAALLTKDFLRLVLAANILAWPITYFALNKWLQNFAYSIGIELWIFALSAGIAVLIAFLTISFQAGKAAAAPPVKSLRYE